MTQLQAIINNHMSLECRCGHRKLVLVNELISRLSPTATIYDVVRMAECSHFETKGTSDFMLQYVCEMKEEV